jgi:hypothetical protein
MNTTNESGGNHTRVRFERFDSSTDERRDEKNVFKYIQRVEIHELARHLVATEDRYNLTTIYDRSGYTPLHFATYRNVQDAIEVLIDFVRHSLCDLFARSC